MAPRPLSRDTPSERNEFIHYTARGELIGLRKDGWKVLLNSSCKNKKRKPMLVHLAEDIGGKNDLASKQPERTTAMTASMQELDNEIGENRRAAWATDKPHPWSKDIN